MTIKWVPAWVPWLLAGLELIALVWLLVAWRTSDNHLKAQLEMYLHPAIIEDSESHSAPTIQHTHTVVTEPDGTVTDTETDLVSDGEDTASSYHSTPVAPTEAPAVSLESGWQWGPRLGIDYAGGDFGADAGLALGIGKGWRIAPTVGVVFVDGDPKLFGRIGVER